jgi:hypothetical protein
VLEGHRRDRTASPPATSEAVRRHPRLARAGVEDIACVDGIGRQLAQQIYDAFHEEAAGP